MDVVAARVAVVGGAILHPVKLALDAALRAVGAVVAVRRVPLTPEVVQAGAVVRELLHELHHRVRRFRGCASFRVVPVYLRHEEIVSK
jgi:hypothetical protein